ncbi:MAG TPA: hypothetical protein VJ865_12400 [Gemmatimonadaceae bacterium]|nr:hypothetical protein [Gemmatimonadaceae bacterium]
MLYPHHNSMSNPGTYVVRPGSSAALTARTIDATQRPVLTRASESVSQAVPQITDSFRNAFTSPVFLSSLALSLIALWILSRMRRQLSGLALGAMLVVALTSFTAPRKPAPKRLVDLSHTPKTKPNRMQSTAWNGYGYIAPRPQEEQVTEYSDQNAYPYPATPVTPNMGPDPVDIVLPATPVTPLPEWRNEVMRAVERRAYRLMQDQQVREIMARIRAQAREEARARRWRQDF